MDNNNKNKNNNKINDACSTTRRYDVVQRLACPRYHHHAVWASSGGCNIDEHLFLRCRILTRWRLNL